MGGVSGATQAPRERDGARADFLLELRSEEIPARMQARARADLAALFAAELAKAGLEAGEIETFATPRRLALIARDLPLETAALAEEIKGPRTTAPAQAIEGFLRKTGLAREQLIERDGAWFARIERPGRRAADVLAEAIPAIIRAFPWPKSMRWGAASVSTESLRWVRPLQGIVAMLGEEVVPVEIAGVRSGAVTAGHRFHHPGPVTLGGARDYVEALRAARVVVDPEERARLIREGAAKAAAEAGLVLAGDEGLVAENAGLTEWPVALLGGFDPAFLDVPREVIQLTMRTNQKYFSCNDRSGDLAPAFVCIANIEATDGGAAIVEGNRKVLAARLADARFFWEQDLKVRLEEQAKKLSGIVFHEKLGTVADKVERVAKLARWLVEQGIVKPLPSRGGVGTGPVAAADGAPHIPHPPTPSPEGEGEAGRLADLAEHAARLAKADLVTGLVGEFPELQGIIGGHLARAQGEPAEVADAIRDHYKPVGHGDDVPTAPVTVAVSLADKLDTLTCFFGIDEKPTGSRDPFALRRAALGINSLTFRSDLRLSQISVLKEAVAQAPIFGPDSDSFTTFELIYGHGFSDGESRSDAELEDRRRIEQLADQVVAFIIDRLKVQQREAGVRHDLIDAVFALGEEDDLVRLLARVKALQAFVETKEGADLLAGYKRAANILKKEGWPPAAPAPQGGEGKEGRGGEGAAPSYPPEPEEAALIAALDAAEPRASAAVAAEDFAGAMSALATLRAPVDAFFDNVTVNDPDPAKREARLDLLLRIRDAVHRVADFSKIEG